MIDSWTRHETVSELGAQSGDGSMSEAHTVDVQHLFPQPAQLSREGRGCLALLVLVLREQGRAVAV